MTITRRALVLLLVYAAYLAAPALHHLGSAAAPVRVEGPTAYGVSLTAHCPNSCEDPSHRHHRPGHDPHHCPVCQAGAFAHLPTDSEVVQQSSSHSGSLDLTAGASPAPQRLPSSESRRGPPTVSPAFA